MHVNPDLLALLALGEPVGSEDELTHLAGCATCQEDLAALQNVVGVGRRTSPEDRLFAPPPQVWQRIREELHLGSDSGGGADPATNGSRATSAYSIMPGSTPLTGPGAAAGLPAQPTVAAHALGAPSTRDPETDAAEQVPGRSTSRSVRLASLALAAVLALVVGIGLGANLDRLFPGQTEVASVQLNALPPWPGSSGRATVEEDREGNRWLVVSIRSPEPATGPREVWLTNTRAEPMVGLGFLHDDSGRFPIAPDINLADYYLVDISQEPAGDSNPRHSGDSMLRGRLPV